VNLDLALLLASIILTILLAAVGVEMANNPPTSSKARWVYRSAFIVLGCFLVGTTYWQGMRNINEQDRLKNDAHLREEKLQQQNGQIQGKLNAIEQYVANLTTSSDTKQIAAAVRAMTESPRGITLVSGDTLDPKYAFETRFILTNHNVVPLTNGSYICEIPNGDPSGIMHFDKPIKLGFAAGSSIEDLPPGQSQSLYCDFTQAEFFAAKANPLIAQVWVSYSYKGKQQKEGFRFFAQRKQDGTFAWFSGGAAKDLGAPNKH
jgi:hypothetical protein